MAKVRVGLVLESYDASLSQGDLEDRLQELLYDLDDYELVTIVVQEVN